MFAAAAAADKPAAFDPFHETPAEYKALRPVGLRDAKFGVFLDWNPSVLCGGEISHIRKNPMVRHAAGAAGDLRRALQEV